MIDMLSQYDRVTLIQTAREFLSRGPDDAYSNSGISLAKSLCRQPAAGFLHGEASE